jgi:hypothetical protein
MEAYFAYAGTAAADRGYFYDEGKMVNVKIERGTRQWLGTLAVGVFVAVMIGTGKIPATAYQHWETLLVGALFYHVVKVLNAPDPKPDAQPPLPLFIPQMSTTPENPTPTQATQEIPQ